MEANRATWGGYDDERFVQEERAVRAARRAARGGEAARGAQTQAPGGEQLSPGALGRSASMEHSWGCTPPPARPPPPAAPRRGACGRAPNGCCGAAV
jgi:hypothetical protein